MKHTDASCQPAPGYIVPVRVAGPKAWLTQEGTVTCDWQQRGIWPTEKAAREAIEKFFDGKEERTIL
jgi:hypothetical protein